MTTPVPPIPSDPGLPRARGLIGQDGVAAVAGFLERRGWAMEAARPVQAIYRPGRSLIVRYRAAARAAAERRSVTVCVESRHRPRRMAPVPDGFGERYGVEDPVERTGELLTWAYPYDPSLAGLPDAAWGPAVRNALAGPGPGPEAVSVEPLRYRPTRRAVFRYRALRLGRRGVRWETAFGKVLPRHKAERVQATSPWLRRAKRSLPLALPAVRLGDDVLMFSEVPGRSLRELLVGGGSLPSPERVAALPSTLASAVEDVGPPINTERPGPAELAGSAADVLSRLVPDSAEAAARVRDAVLECHGREPTPLSVVHGDLYEAQVVVGDRYSLGLIDLDDLGLGDPALDAANFCAHLLALAMAVPAAAGRLVAYRRLVRASFARTLDMPIGALAWREALSMLLLAAGPFRVLDPAWPTEVGRRVALAVRLLEEP